MSSDMKYDSEVLRRMLLLELVLLIIPLLDRVRDIKLGSTDFIVIDRFQLLLFLLSLHCPFLCVRFLDVLFIKGLRTVSVMTKKEDRKSGYIRCFLTSQGFGYTPFAI